MDQLSRETIISNIEQKVYKFINNNLEHLSPSERLNLIQKYNSSLGVILKLNKFSPDLKDVKLVITTKISRKSSINFIRKEIILYMLDARLLKDKNELAENLDDLKDYYTDSFRKEFKTQLEFLIEESGIELSNDVSISFTTKDIDEFISKLADTTLKYIDAVVEKESPAEDKIKELDSLMESFKLTGNKFIQHLFKEICTDSSLVEFYNKATKDTRAIFRIKTRIQALRKSILNSKVPHLEKFKYNLETGLDTDTITGNLKEIVESYIENDYDFAWFFDVEFDDELWDLFLTIFLKKNFGERIDKVNLNQLKEEAHKVHEDLKEDYANRQSDKEKDEVDRLKVFIDSIQDRIKTFIKSKESTDEIIKDILDSNSTLFGYATKYILTDYKDIKNSQVFIKYKDNIKSIIEKSFEANGVLKQEVKDKVIEDTEDSKGQTSADYIVTDIGRVSELKGLEVEDLIPFIQTSDTLSLDNMVDDYPDQFKQEDERELYSNVIDELLKSEYKDTWLLDLKELIKDQKIKPTVLPYYKEFILNLSGNILNELKEALTTGYSTFESSNKYVSSQKNRTRLVTLFNQRKSNNLKGFIDALEDFHFNTDEVEAMDAVLEIVLNYGALYKAEEKDLNSVIKVVNNILEKLELEIYDLEREIERFPQWPEDNSEDDPKAKRARYNRAYNKGKNISYLLYKELAKPKEAPAEPSQESLDDQKAIEENPELEGIQELKDLDWDVS